MVDHSEYKRMIVEFLYGEITPQRESLLLRHLAQCEECRRELREIRQAREILQPLRNPAPSPRVVLKERVSLPWAAALFLLSFLFLLFNLIYRGLPRTEGLRNPSQITETLEIKEPPDFSVLLEDYEAYFLQEEDYLSIEDNRR